MNKKEFQKTFNQATQAFQVGDYGLAEELGNKLLDFRQDLWPLQLLMGNICLRMEKLEKSMGYYESVLALAPENREATNNLAVLYRLQGDYDKSYQWLEKALEQDAENADLLYNRGNLAKAKGNWNQAMEDYHKVLDLDPNYLQAYNNLGTIYVSREDWESAAQVYDQGLKLDPHNPSLLYNRGMLYQQQENWDQAEQYFKAALDSRPGWEDCLNNLAIVLQEKGKLQDSCKIYREILNKDSQNPRVWNNIGVVLNEMGQEEEAQECYKTALEMAPEYKNASMNLNQSYAAKKDYAQALEEMNRLATLYPFDLEVRNEIGQALIRLNQLNEAEETFLHILEREPDHLGALKDLTELKVRQGDEEAAWNYLKRAGKQAFLDDMDALVRVADAFRKNGNNARAEELLQMMEDYRPGDHRVRNQLSRILEEQERWDEALNLLPQREEDQDLPRRIRLNLNQGNRTEAMEDMDRLMTQHSQEGTQENLDAFREFLDLYEETSASIMEENRERWENNLFKLTRTIKSLQNTPQEWTEEAHGPSLLSQSMMEEENLTLLDIHAMEPIIEINEEREVLYLEDAEEDFSEIYTEVMEEEQQRRHKEYHEKQGFPSPMPGYNPYPPPPPPQPIVIPVPSYSPAPPAPEPRRRTEKEELEELQEGLEETSSRQDEIDMEFPIEDDDGIVDFDERDHQEDMEVDPEGFPEEEAELAHELVEEPEESAVEKKAADEKSSGKDRKVQEESPWQEEKLTIPEEAPQAQRPIVVPPIQMTAPPAAPQPPSSESGSVAMAEPETSRPAASTQPSEMPPLTAAKEELFPPSRKEQHSETVQYIEPDPPTPPKEPELPRQAVNEPQAVQPQEESKLDKNAVAGMLKYLSGLSDSLPEQRKKEMIEREVPLKLEVVRSKLEGEKSLLHTAANYDRRSRDRVTDIDISEEKLNNSMNFFKNMAHLYPDMKVSKTFDSKMGKLLEKINKIHGDEK